MSGQKIIEGLNHAIAHARGEPGHATEHMMDLHPKLSRRMVWCKTCGRSQKVDGNPLRDGWPKCCGYTMTIDAPDER